MTEQEQAILYLENYRKEGIATAAVKYRLKSENEDRYVYGFNHASCISYFAAIDLPVSKRKTKFEESGFITTKGKFVDRKTAAIIAFYAAQMNEIVPELYSEMLYRNYLPFDELENSND